MTEDQHEALLRIGNAFWLEFSEVCEKHLAAAIKEGVSPLDAETYLSEKTSWYGRKVKSSGQAN